MELRACPACRRHVVVAATQCPFCAAALGTVAPSPSLASGRLSRAAVFAGALSTTACSAPSAQRPSPPAPSAPEASVAMATPVDAQPMPAKTPEAPVDAGSDVPAVRQPDGDPTAPPTAGTAKLSGRVLLNGKPLANVSVNLFSITFTGLFQTAKTDRSGVYVFDKVVASGYSVLVSSDDVGPYVLEHEVTLQISDGEEKTQDVIVMPPPTASVRGRVLHKGKPMPHIDVSLADTKNTREVRHSSTDAAGRYRFEHVIADDYELRVDANHNGGYGLKQAAMVTVKGRKAKTED